VDDKLHTPATLLLAKDHVTHYIEVWVGPTAGVDAVAKTISLSPTPAGNQTSVVHPID